MFLFFVDEVNNDTLCCRVYVCMHMLYVHCIHSHFGTVATAAAEAASAAAVLLQCFLAISHDCRL